MLDIETIIFKVLKFFLRSVNERQVITHTKIEMHDGKNVFLECIVSTSLEINYDSI